MSNYTTRTVIKELGQSNIARALGLSRYTVYSWTKTKIAAKHCKALVEYAKSQGIDVKKSDFRPDIFD